MTMNRRILIGKPGLDGHDRGAKYVAQVLRDAGFEVIYSGIRRTPEQIVWSALQEDVAAVGLSLLSGAHMGLFARVLESLAAADASDMLVFGGGVIPEEDCRQLQASGVAAIFRPGAAADQIVQAIESMLASRQGGPSAEALALELADVSIPEVRRGRLAAQLMTALEANPEQLTRLQPLLDKAEKVDARPLVVGITGAPGSGKSTLLAALVQVLRQRRPSGRFGIIAVDPSSPVTRGAILGDRVRMMHLSDSPGVFIRSLATRGQIGGLAAAVRGAVAVLHALGCGVIFIETVGVGQNETDVATLADQTMLVLAPGQGDDIQMLKAGVLEVADLVVVNKADHPDAQRTYQHALEISQSRQHSRVAMVSALSGQGVSELTDQLDQPAHRGTAGTPT